jgi:hypothetical protein
MRKAVKPPRTTKTTPSKAKTAQASPFEAGEVGSPKQTEQALAPCGIAITHSANRNAIQRAVIGN